MAWPILGEEDRVWHRRVVPLAGEVVFFHAERLEIAVRRIVAGPAGGYRPAIAVLPIDRDSHFLRRLVDDDHDVGARGLREGKRGDDRAERERKKVETHATNSSLIRAQPSTPETAEQADHAIFIKRREAAAAIVSIAAKMPSTPSIFFFSDGPLVA